jgi:hypothetical protein
MRETALVTILMKGGVRHSTAVFVERLLDDRGGRGVGGDWLAGIIERLIAFETHQLAERLDQAETVCELAGWYKPTGKEDKSQLRFE